MEQPKQRVFVFDKAELFFLFLFFIVMAITAFVLGMRLGKKQAELFLHPEASQTQTALDLKSKHEENIENTPADATPSAAAESEAFVDKKATNGTTAPADVDEETFKKLQAEYQKLNAQDMGVDTTNSAATTVPPTAEESAAMENTEPTKVPEAATTPELNSDQAFLNPDSSFIGKYTIQLGSYRTLDEAKNFANGFLVKGYKPLVREVDVRGQGTWYRVSLGVFESISAATQYIQKENSLFGAFKKDQYFVQEIK
jgi:cell division septation protein DedD